MLDPVGAGATRFRTEAARRLLGEAPVAVLRGNGHPLMSRVTGTGCAASAITGAFCGVAKDAFAAAAGALVTFGIAGEIAARDDPRPGSFQIRPLDALDAVDSATIRECARVALQ